MSLWSKYLEERGGHFPDTRPRNLPSRLKRRAATRRRNKAACAARKLNR